MEEIIKLIEESGYGFLATVENGKPRVRPFGFMFAEDGKYYFCTNSTKDVYKQLIESPYIEYSFTTKNMVTGRINGQITFCEDIAKKEKAINSDSLVKNLYKSADNPIFKIFYIEHGNAIIADFSGNPPREFEF